MNHDLKSARRNSELVEICLREYDYATKIGDAKRAAEAAAGMAEYAANIATAARALGALHT